MRTPFFFITTLVVGLHMGQTNAVETHPVTSSWTAQQEVEFDQKLQRELAKQGQDISNLENQVIKENKSFAGELKEEFQGKVNSLQAKQVLYNKFQHASSLQSQAVREKLLAIFQKPILTEQDFQELQTVVDQQKSKK